MKKINKLSSLTATLLMAASMGSAYADEGDTTQTRTQDRIRVEKNLQTPASDYGQAFNREQKTVENREQNRNQYRYEDQHRNNYQTQQPYSGSSTMNSTGRSSTGGSRRGKH